MCSAIGLPSGSLPRKAQIERGSPSSVVDVEATVRYAAAFLTLAEGLGVIEPAVKNL